MARLARVVLPGVPHHIVQRGVRAMRIFENDQDRYFYLKILRKHTDKYGLKIVTWCLMSNHVHLIAIPESSNSLSAAMGNAHRAYSVTFNKRHDTKGFLFQGRFYSTPMDQTHFYAAVRYVLRNPVRAGLVVNPIAYLWSSALYNSGSIAEDALVKSNDLLDWIGHWDEYLSDDPREIKDLRLCTRTGRPCGDKEFIERAENISGRTLRKRKPGRKP